MATCLYANVDPTTATFGNALGCGWVHEVPAAFPGAVAPCVILAGAGQTVVLPDDGTLTAAKVAAALAPILAAEQADAATAAAGASNRATLQQRALAALAVNAAFINAAKPGTAAAQASAAYDQAVRVTKECSALIRLALDIVDDISGT